MAHSEKLGFIAWLQGLFHKKDHEAGHPQREKFKLEPKYWQEVIDFSEKLKKLIAEHTISDPNIQIINGRIIDYMLDQINTKGSIPDISARYAAINTLADRFLSSSLSKIVGMKESENTHAEFSDAVKDFKKRLHERQKEELAAQQEKNKPNM